MKRLIATGLLGMALPVGAQQTIDVHTHIIIPEYVEVLKAHGAELEETFPLPEWDAERHIAFMDSVGIRTAILTMPAPQPYYGDEEESARCIRRVNEVAAEVKREYPGRFLFCATLPLPDVDAAIREAVYALDTLGADGVKLATNSRGQYLGDEALDPLMEVLNERHALIIIHPHRPTPYPEKIIATTPDHILYGSDYPYLPDAVLKANLQRLKRTLASDEELTGYMDMFLWGNAVGLFK